MILAGLRLGVWFITARFSIRLGIRAADALVRIAERHRP